MEPADTALPSHMLLVWVVQLQGKNLGPVYGADSEVRMLNRELWVPRKHRGLASSPFLDPQLQPREAARAYERCCLAGGQVRFWGLQPECLR